jgi:hypothetical protein
MTLHWPQVVILTLLAIVALGSTVLHGRPKTGSYNAFAGILSALIEGWVLWMGGFFG